MSSEIPKIGCDYDEVVSTLYTRVFDVVNEEQGTNFRLADIDIYNYYHLLGSVLSDSEITDLVYRVIEETPEQPVRGAIPGLVELSRDFELHFFTTRRPAAQEATTKALEDLFGNSLGPLFLDMMGKSDVIAVEGSKMQAANEIGAIALIDDMVEHVQPAADYDMHGVLFGSYPWNQADVLPANVVRCQTWPAVLKFFDEWRDEQGPSAN